MYGQTWMVCISQGDEAIKFFTCHFFENRWLYLSQIPAIFHDYNVIDFIKLFVIFLIVTSMAASQAMMLVYLDTENIITF